MRHVPSGNAAQPSTTCCLCSSLDRHDMSTGERHWDAPDGHVRKHITAMEAAGVGNCACNHSSPGQTSTVASPGVSYRHVCLTCCLPKCLSEPQTSNREVSATVPCCDSDLCLQTSRRKSPAVRQSTGSLQAGHAARRHNTDATGDEVRCAVKGYGARIAGVTCSLHNKWCMGL